MLYKDLESKKKIVIDYIKRNPKTTYRDIRKKLKIHSERIFKGGLAEAFKEAEVDIPRSFENKTKKEKQKIIINIIKKNPNISSFQIKKELKINVPSSFKSIKEAYNLAGIEYPRKKSYNRSPNQKRSEIIKLIKQNPYITLTEIKKKTDITNIYKLFKNINEIYKKSKIKRVGQGEKIKHRKRRDVINFIKTNNLATQREINKACKTKVQEIFKRGIFEAYKKAAVNYPFGRLKLYGTALKEIKKRAKSFEDEISVKLYGFGTVNRLVKTKRGVADVILERNNKKMIIEIKDYQNKEICISQINQLNKYLEDCNCNLGALICHKKPKKDKFLIGKNQIFILDEQELNKIPELFKGS
jgi:predicted transcriptional regulator